MNIDNLISNHQQLFRYLEEQEYSPHYILRIRKQVEYVFANAEYWKDYPDALTQYLQTNPNKEQIHHFKVSMNVIARFDLYELYPNGKRQFSCLESSQETLADDFQQLINDYKEKAARRGVKASTIHGQVVNTSKFLMRLQENGIVHRRDISESAVLEGLTNPDGTPRYSISYNNQIRAVFAEAASENCENARISALIPSLRRHRKNIQFFTDKERASIKETLTDEGKLSYRDRAIGTLLFYTGLRASDVAGLLFSSIDWENDEIRIIQQKTDTPLVIPLMVPVGNALYDYICNERRQSMDPHIFLSKNKPFAPMTAGSISGVANSIYKAANIRQMAGDKRGAHLFRHNFATSLLENGISRAIITELLGHTSPESTIGYISADIVHLRECAISIENFPWDKGVFIGD